MFQYTVLLHDLLCDLEKCMYGVYLHDVNVTSPTVADDMALMALTEKSLNICLQKVFDYSREWHFDHNSRKPGLLVFTETNL